MPNRHGSNAQTRVCQNIVSTLLPIAYSPLINFETGHNGMLYDRLYLAALGKAAFEIWGAGDKSRRFPYTPRWCACSL